MISSHLEWDRANEQTIEYILTAKRLLRHIKPGERVLDLGGGPGRYSLMLAAYGCDVTLSDLSPGNIALAKEKAMEAGVSIHSICADARDVSAYPDGIFDHILIMGPMYHLADETQRRQVMHHALGRLRPGGKAYIAFINLYAGIQYYLDCRLSGPFDGFSGDIPYVDAVIADESWQGTAFSQVRFDSINDIKVFCGSLGLRQIDLFGQEGNLGSHVNRIMALPETDRQIWINLADKLCDKPEYLNHSDHILYIGEKP